MINTKSILKQEMTRLEALLDSVPMVDTGRPKGSLRVCKNKAGVTYYYVQTIPQKGGSDQTVERLGDGSSQKVRRIKQERFIRELRKRLEKNIGALKAALGTAADFDFDDVVNAMPAAYQAEKECYCGALSDVCGERKLPDSRGKAWMAASYLKNPADFTVSHTAITGEAVRSKSEVIIYDLLVKYGVPFRYECALKLIDFNGLETVKYPDFTILPADGRFIILEHLGMLSDERYLSSSMSKLALYNKNGLTIGENLIITSDDANGGINSEAIARMIENVILPLL